MYKLNKMYKLKRVLPRYFRILEGKLKAKFKLTNLDDKIKKSFKVLESCELCERKCKVNRIKNKFGWCGVGKELKISSIFRHFGEEYFLVPSLTIFFWSCTFECQYCQNWEISQRFSEGNSIKERELARRINEYKNCKNINFVGGDPTPYLPFILKTLKYIRINLPVVWNSNFYMSKKSMGLLKGVIDIYLSDFKYGNNKCARRLSKVDNYMQVIKRNHLLAFKDSELIIRHLILPNHIECCSKPILEFIKKKFEDKVIVNIMAQYRPGYKARDYPEINRLITKEEFEEVVDYAKKLKLNFMI